VEAEFLTLERRPHDRCPRKRFRPWRQPNRRLKLLHFPEENVSDLRAALIIETRAIVKIVINSYLRRVRLGDFCFHALRLFELARVLVRFDHVARPGENANHGIV
jgi:hypothetical protein